MFNSFTAPTLEKAESDPRGLFTSLKCIISRELDQALKDMQGADQNFRVSSLYVKIRSFPMCDAI